MYTVVDICNLALGRIGVDRTIIGLTEQSKEARNCKRFYELCRDEVLERVPWPFAVRVQPLAPLADAELLPGWAYQYSLPTDAVGILEVIGAGEVGSAAGYYRDCSGPWNALRGTRHAFTKAMSSDNTAQVVLCNLDDAYLVYTSRAINTNLYSALMVSALADRLSMELAMPMTADPRWFQVAQQRYQASFIDAASRQLEQQRDGPERLPPSIVARG